MALFPEIYPADPSAPENIRAKRSAVEYGILGRVIFGLVLNGTDKKEGEKKRWNAPGHWFERGRMAAQKILNRFVGRGLAAG